jgi:hypothetical protein
MNRKSVTHVKKKVEAKGKFDASNDATEVGLFKMVAIEAIMPEDKVTIRNECYGDLRCRDIVARERTHNNLEDKEPSHQGQLNTRLLRNALEFSKEA